MTPARTRYAVPDMDDAREFSRLASAAIEAAREGAPDQRELADRLFRAIYGASHLFPTPERVPMERPATVTVYIGDQEKWCKVARLLDHPDHLYDERILLVRGCEIPPRNVVQRSGQGGG